ncbi:hypothetical protein VNO77_11870 [Canavalia gladiata]|uniref:Uncharacterized protein n=1 Tax=Canavalia gladiata TaxID=3824 RepID=A0AAN9M020_CANGL
MGNRIHVSLLMVMVVFVMCLNGSIRANSLTPSQTPPIIQPHLNESYINILVISIANDLPPGSENIYFSSSFRENKLTVKQGHPVAELANFDLHWGELRRMSSYARFYLYDPEQDGSHQRIYYSARTDAVYRSWDNKNWEIRVGWVKI